MTSRRVCLVAALLVLALAIVGIITTPKCGDDRGVGPVLALELARNTTEIEALVTTPECGAGLRENTYVDMAVFIPSFTIFLIAGALIFSRKLAIPFFALGALCDWTEDSVMLHLLGMQMPTFEWLAPLFIASRVKFFALSVGIMLVGWAAKSTARVHGWLMIIGGAIAICGLPIDNRLLMPGTLLAWFSLAIFALRNPK